MRWLPRMYPKKKFFFNSIHPELVAQRVKRLPPMWETWVQFLGQEDPLEKEMVTRSSILPGESRGWGSLVGYIQSMGSQRVGHD